MPSTLGDILKHLAALQRAGIRGIAFDGATIHASNDRRQSKHRKNDHKFEIRDAGAAAARAIAGDIVLLARDAERHQLRLGAATGAFGQAIGEEIIGEIGEPEEIAGAAVFLAGPSGSFTTGQTIVIDGGVTIGSPVQAAG